MKCGWLDDDQKFVVRAYQQGEANLSAAKTIDVAGVPVNVLLAPDHRP